MEIRSANFWNFSALNLFVWKKKKSKIMEIISVILYPVFYYPDHLSHFITYQYRYISHYLKKILWNCYLPHFYTNKSNQYVCNCGSIQNFPNRWDNFLKKIYICPNNMLKLLRKSYFMQQDHRCMSYWSKCYQYYKIILSSCILLYTWHSHVMKLFRTFNIHSTDMHDIHHSKYYHRENNILLKI